jgi:Tfp pilus assembly protein PilO
MSNTMKNIVVTLLIATVAFVGYYFYIQNKNDSLTSGVTRLTPEMKQRVEAVKERRTRLEQINLNTEFLSSAVFRSYRSFKEPVPATEVGRPNPFARTNN